MDLFHAIVLAIAQGITEWLPVSSSGHLAIFEHFFGMKENLTYNVLLHFSSLIVILVVFYKDIIRLNRKFYYYIGIGTIPIVIVGLLIKDHIQAIFNNMIFVSLGLIITGVILLLTNRKTNKKIDTKRAFGIGMFQALAILPGVSRSGSTIGGAMNMGVKKEDAITFSFLLAVPALLGAAALNITDMVTRVDSSMVIGFFVSMIVSYFCLKWLIKLVKKNKLKMFSYYCFALAIILMIFGG